MENINGRSWRNLDGHAECHNKDKEFVLADAPHLTASGVTVRHHDRMVIDRALKAALEAKRGLYIPSGHYRIGYWKIGTSVRPVSRMAHQPAACRSQWPGPFREVAAAPLARQ